MPLKMDDCWYLASTQQFVSISGHTHSASNSVADLGGGAHLVCAPLFLENFRFLNGNFKAPEVLENFVNSSKRVKLG